MGAFDGLNLYQQRTKMRGYPEESTPVSDPTFYVCVRRGHSRHFKRRHNAENYATRLEAQGYQVSRWYR